MTWIKQYDKDGNLVKGPADIADADDLTRVIEMQGMATLTADTEEELMLMTGTQITDAIAQAQLDKKDILLSKIPTMEMLVAIVKTMAQYTNKTNQEVFNDIKANY